MRHYCAMLALVVCLAVSARGQQTGVLKGTVTDDTGAVIPGANISVLGSGSPKTVSTNESGQYTMQALTPGAYLIRVTATGFGVVEKNVEVSASATVTFDAPLRVTLSNQEITVQGDNNAQVTTDPTQNAGAVVLKPEDLEALSDDPDALAADLQALAGPSAGPNGGQIYVDGFSGARLPPKASIREVRINQNPFSSEFDRLGFGRIEIFTKPGADRYRGQAMFNFSDESLNSRNPYSQTRPAYQSRLTSIDFGGPLTKKSSFSLDFEKRDIDNNAILNATALDAGLNPVRIQDSILTPNRRTNFTPRFDYQLSTNHTLVTRYEYLKSDDTNTGVGDLALLSRGYNRNFTEQSLQMTETAVLSGTVINETRFQYRRRNDEQIGDNSTPSINVQGSFQGGGAQVGESSTRENRFELSNITSMALGQHSVKLGGRLRYNTYRDVSPRNFGGTFTFTGGLAPELGPDLQPVLDPSGERVQIQLSSLERYRRTLQLINSGLSDQEVKALGYGANQFSIAGGNPLASVNQTDGALFVQDDWKLRPNFTLSLGLRYELQTNVSDWTNIAPRVGFAWAPRGRGGSAGKTVIRGGFGSFYDRVEQDLALDTIRFDGSLQQQYVLQRPDFFRQVPSTEQLGVASEPQTIQTFARGLRVPYLMQAVLGVERQLPGNTTVAVNFTASRGVHLLRSVNIGPLVGLNENIYQYDSSGVLDQRQMIVTVNSRVSRRISIFSFYVLNNAKSDTDSSSTFPGDPGNWRADYGRSNLDIRHRWVLGGNVTAPWGVRLAPFVTARSGTPYNITVGNDLNGDNLFTDRPSFVDPLSPGPVARSSFNSNPLPGQGIIPRNYGEGPGYFAVNMRMSRTWGFGGKGGNAAVAAPASGGGGRGGPGGQGGMQGPVGGPRGFGGGGGGGGRGGGGGGGGRGFGGFDGGSTEQRFNVTLMLSARNFLNNVNPGPPIGVLSSPLFGVSNQTAGGFGPGSDANNRRVDFGLRFTF